MADHRSLRAPEKRIETLVQPGSARRSVAAAIVHDVPRHIEQTLFDELRTGALSDNPDDCLRAAKAAVAKGTRPEDIADFYVPALAREMGDQWCKDQLSFAGVTIGTSRLQAVLRALGPNWSGDNVSGPNGPSILLIVGQEVYHTLGAIVLSGQLRRKGFSVKLILGGKHENIADQISRTNYQGVFISSSCGETLESLRKIVKSVKSSTTNPPPLVVGGTLLEVETAENVMALTGADYATNIPDEALKFCGLQVITQASDGT
jgi:methanogenic corrinoid protein MtbC1